MEKSEWRTASGFPAYEVSFDGNVRRNGRLLAPISCNGGYFKVNIWGPEGRYPARINRLVCETFNGPPPSQYHQAAHKNGVPTDNRADNLYWATPLENCADKERHGTAPKGETHGKTKLTSLAVRDIREKLRSGMSYQTIAESFGVGPHAIGRIARGETWGHLK